VAVHRERRSATVADVVVVVVVVTGRAGKRGGREQTTAADHGPGADATRLPVVQSFICRQGAVGRRSGPDHCHDDRCRDHVGRLDDDDDAATAAATRHYDPAAAVANGHFDDRGRSDHSVRGLFGPAVLALQTVADHWPAHVPHHTGPLEGQDLRTGQQGGRSERCPGDTGPQPHRQPTARRTEPEKTRPLLRFTSMKPLIFGTRLFYRLRERRLFRRSYGA